MRNTYFALTTLLLLAGVPASAATDPATWNRSVERLDYYLNPPQGGDNDFFTSVANANDNINVVLLYPATQSMGGFTQKLYKIRADLSGGGMRCAGGTNDGNVCTVAGDCPSGLCTTGCANNYLNNLSYFMPTNVKPPVGLSALQGVYSNLKVYPDPLATYAGSAYGGEVQNDYLNAAKFYQFRSWPIETTSGLAPGPVNTVILACDGAAGGAGAASTACQACVARRGYWLNPAVANNNVTSSAGVFSPNWLRFHPTKWVLLNLAYKRLIRGPLLDSLREAVIATNGNVGGQLIQKMLPQSCNGNGRPRSQKAKAIDGLDYSSTGKPLAEMLINAGWYMGGQESPWVFANNSTRPSTFPNTNSGPCNSCNADFIIMFSDGRGDVGNPACAGAPASCTVASNCSTLGMGTENDGNDFLDPALVSGTGAAIYTPRSTPAGTCDMDLADDVAGWMSSNNNSLSVTPSRLKTYVIAIGDPANTYGEMTILDQIAQRGGGNYVVADDFRNLETNIELVFKSIRNTSTSFSSTALTTVQTSGNSSAFIPRFKPTLAGAWTGTIARYSLFNEFSSGCVPSNYGTASFVNPNGDSSCTDFYLKDSLGQFVRENSRGDFGLVNTGAAYDGGWPLQVAADGGIVPATPFWEAGELLRTRETLSVLTNGASGARRIFTVAPSGAGYSSTLVNFTVANVATLAPLMLLGGVQGELCTEMAAKSLTVYATENDCASDLIRFVHGEDVFLENPLNRTPAGRVSARRSVLGDIFHSSPILVLPPVPKFLCDLGLVSQCVPTLYARDTDGGYDSYFNTNRYRTENLLVGANDGMVHAFNAANDVAVTTSDGGVTHTYDEGTGAETWAFIPPDLLPKLARYALSETHQLLVDGTPMVRDIWADLNGDNAKTSNEFRTVAIVGEREGGRGYLALDVTNPATPVFLWSWPTPGTAEALQLGMSWNDIGSYPPAIGPIAEYFATGFTVNGSPAKERYVVAIGGGFEPSLVRGRSVHFLDAYTGAEVYRFSRGDSTGGADLRGKIYPVAAPVAMVDSNSDGLFDTAVVGDVAGQVWTIGMSKPGRDTNSDGLYDNWFGARAFAQYDGAAIKNRSAFFHRASVALLQSGDLRAYLGSGDRDHVKSINGGICGPANIQGCLKQNCSSVITEALYNIGPPTTGVGGGAHSIAGAITFTPGATSITDGLTYDTQPQASATNWVAVAQTDYAFNCGGAQAVSAVLKCDWGVTDAGTDCPVNTGLAMGSPYTSIGGSAVQNTYFYSIKLFQAGGRDPFTTTAGATTYDGNRLTETSLVDAATTVASAGGNGWYLKHVKSSDEKSAAAPLLYGGCLLWDTIDPNPSPAFACGSPAPTDTAWAYQANAISGAVSCGLAGSSSYLATTRAVSRQVTVNPAPKGAVVSVNPVTGQISYSAVGMEPGVPPTSTTIGSSAVSGLIHWLEVPRKTHDCRHGGINCQ